MTEGSTTLKVLVGVFLVLEAANVLTLYFAPGSKVGNGVGVFAGWTKSQEDADLHDFVRYLVFWVAGTKLIFIALWLVLLFTAGPVTQFWASAVMIPAIATFYWRLFPIIRRLDTRGQLVMPGYSKVLGWMILGFIAAFIAALAAAA